MKWVLAFLLIPSLSIGQLSPEIVRQQLDQTSCSSYYKKAVALFYEWNGYRFAWTRPASTSLKNQVLNTFSSAEDFGFDRSEYKDVLQIPLAISMADSVRIDVKITISMLRFLTDLKYGEEPALRYSGVSLEPNRELIAALAVEAANHNNWNEVIQKAESNRIEYTNAKRKLKYFNTVTSSSDFSEVIIKSKLVDKTNLALINKLYQLGFIESTSVVTDKLLSMKLKEAQKNFDVLSDGQLKSTTLAALNVSLKERTREIKILLNNIRWLENLQNEKQIAIVNIPSATLYVYGKDSMNISSKIIAGKPSTPTPTLSSKINEVIIYPYWHVPVKIAVGELLPRIKKDIGYLDANGYQVLSKSGKVLNPYSINWHALNASYFPYTIRQSTGCDNSLGVLKFNFYSPFTVYLHDTPSKGLFDINKRFFSHGCMRVEKPVDLARFLLHEKRNYIDSLTSECLKDQKPKTLPLAETLPVVVLYSVAWYTDKGEIRFYADVYNKM
jgi:L,D-transpeptidase YcbB